MFSHVLIKNSRIGFVCQTVGSHKLEKVWVALAGSYTKKWSVNAEKIMKGLAYLKYFLHLLHSFPVFTVKVEISVSFAFE
jgi:hypothetical protein